MGAQRTDMHRLQELVRYHRLGRSARNIAWLLGMGRDTIRGYSALLGQAGLLDGDASELPALDVLAEVVKAHLPAPATPPQRRSTVEAHRGEIERLGAKGAQPTAIHDWLRLHVEGYTGTVSAIKRLCQRPAREEEPKPESIAIAVETAPGEVAQVDFGYAGLRYDPVEKVMRRAWLFLMTLGFSRHQFADLVFDLKAETWLRLHVAAFEFFGGAPRVRHAYDLPEQVLEGRQMLLADASGTPTSEHGGFNGALQGIASMGPRLESRGDLSGSSARIRHRGCGRRHRLRFNGAAA